MNNSQNKDNQIKYGFSKTHPLILNGKILTQKITGVQRYGIEVIKQIDELVQPGEVILAVPDEELQTNLTLRNIQTQVVGGRRGNLWTQIDLPGFAARKNGSILTFAGIPPLTRPDYVVAHDISFIRYSRSYKLSFRLLYRIGYRLTLLRCKGIITVSQFSKNELMSYYGLDENRITIAGNSAEHFEVPGTIEMPNVQKVPGTIEETKVSGPMEEVPGTDTPYYLSVGSASIHKNQSFIEELARLHPDKNFIITGARYPGKSASPTKSDNIESARHHSSFTTVTTGKLPNITYTGYITDEELKNLYKNTKAFIFPSLYEGFGIPPMEAIAMGNEHIALADIPALREIYTKGCYFFDPKNPEKFDFQKLEEQVADSITTDRATTDHIVTANTIAEHITTDSTTTDHMATNHATIDKPQNNKPNLKEYYLNKYSWRTTAQAILKTIN
ncbi:glycosyltransferase family 4 protein [Butyrivibrio sp. FC2001]|uniref:glycosyltransferase family 4 protein n=1 Tax=Butyrivibrio sp. FC2001 TaxID=1280671 RepID=UPI000419E35F|nr:glycosyltransferase family 1 protein [Butyrivibrio sp. FC2001]